jgi:hypothetical protein
MHATASTVKSLAGVAERRLGRFDLGSFSYGGAVIRGQRDGKVYHAAVAPLPHGKSAAPEHSEHGAILTQHVGLELGQVLLSGDGRQMSK